MDQIGKKQAVNSPETALANEIFDQFCNATTLKSILGYYRQLCELLKIRPNVVNQFYPKLKTKLRSWKAQALWKKFDQRANHKCYNRGKVCPNTRVLIIGGGPCGLRTAIEAQLLGAKVVVVEKRDRMSRNNVLHLWPFVIQDLRGLGAKKFFGKFCAGSIDHISIRQLQCILLKVALILGVEFHESVSFDSLIQPPNNQEDGKIGWRAKTSPADHPVSQYEFDVLIGADGKRNTLEGFKRKEFRGKLAIAITANFINKRTEAEARVEEISGVAFIFNQKFFKELYQETGIDLENIVYYKDDTHYFVMTAKKHSLIDKGVILQDHADTAKLLAKENVDREALMLYAREAAEFSTEYQMMDMEFAVNHYGQPDVAMFDFTSMYAAENASRVLERHGHRLLMILVGDSLLEPFWPTGSGCARGFLSSLDAGWTIKGWGASLSPLEVIAERESIYRLLGQTTPENLNRDYAAYTLDPHTRYPNLNIRSVTPIQVRSLLDTDDPESIKQPVIQSEIDIPKKRRRRDLRADTQVHPDILLRWLQKQVVLYDKVHIEDIGASFKDGLAICAIIHRYRPDLIDFYSLNAKDTVKNNQLAFDILEKELNIPPIMTGEEMVQCDVPDTLAMFSYLTQIYEVFRGEIPYIKHPKLEPEMEECTAHSKQLKQWTSEEKVMKTRHSRSRHANENVHSYMDKKDNTISRRSRKRRSTEKVGTTMAERQKRLDEIEKHQTERMKKRQYLRKMATQQFYKSMQMLQANAKREKDEPFEDYSIFLYRQTAPDFKDRVKDLEQKILYPDRQPKIHISYRRDSVDEEFSGRIKDFEDKLKGTTSSEKKPKDLLRAIGKIEKTDWNVKEIEKKIEENKMGRSVRHERVEKVPKWSREQVGKKTLNSTDILALFQMCICFIQFLARQIKMEKRGNDQRNTYSKYADIDNTLKNIGKKIQEGSALGYNKVSAMAEQFSNKNQDVEPKLQKSNTKPTIALPVQGGSEMCHFCNKRVYLMERLSAEGKFFHRGCFRCEYCSISLRIGNHTFDREKNGGRFYCTQHFGLSGTMKSRAEKKRINLVNKENVPNATASKTPEKVEIKHKNKEQGLFDSVYLLMTKYVKITLYIHIFKFFIIIIVQIINDNEVFEEAIDQPLTTEGTLELAKNWTLRYSHPHATIGQSDTGSNEYEDSSDEYTSEDDESGTATEDEEDVRARELRKQEVWLKVPPRNCDTDTGSETEVKQSQDSIDPAIVQESFISFESKVTSPTISNMNTNDNDLSSERNTFGELLKFSNETTLISNELAKMPNNTNDNISDQNESLIFLTSIALDHLDKEDCNSEYESFVDESIRLELDELDENNKDSRVSDNETILNANELPGVITSLNENKNSLSSSSSEIYQSVEMLCDNSIISDHLDDLVEYSKSNLPEEIEIFKCENISFTNQSKDSYFINKDRNVEFIDDSNNIHMSNIIDKNVGIHSTTPIPPANILQESIHPIVIVTSPSPTQEIQLDELSLETSRLLVPLEARSVPSFGNCDNAFDKLKRDLKQRKAKNKAIGNELRPLSTEYAQLKMSKYFTENKKIVSKDQVPIQSEGAEDISNLKMVKLHIKPKLSNRVNAEEMLKYFNKTSSSNSNKFKTSNIIAIKQNERRKLEIDIEKISNLDENDIDVIDQQFNQIEEQSKIANLEKRINSIDYVLNSDINETNQEKKDNINLNSNTIGDIIKENNIIKTDVQTNILNNTENEEKRANTMNLDGTILTISNSSDEKQANKIHISSDNLDKDNKSKKNLLFGNNTLLNGKLTAPSRLNNNTDKVIKYNRLHKSDTNLNEDTPRVFSKSINSYSKSLSELKNTTFKDEPAVKTIIVKKIVNTSMNIKDTIINNNLAENCVKKVPKRPERKNVSYDIISPLQKTLIENSNLKISNTELSPPEISVRRKLAKKNLKLLCRNQAIEGMPKLQNVQRPIRRNVAKLQSRDITNLSNFNNEIIKDVKNIMIAENHNVTDMSKLQSQSKSVMSAQEVYHPNSHLSNKPEESIKFIPKNSHSKKDKCIVVSSEDASTDESVENSATEISTDSEFEHDEATPTQHEIPEITINDSYVRKTRGAYVEPKKVQVKSKMISSINGNLTQDKKKQQDTREQFLEDHIKMESNKEVNCNVPASVDTNNCTPLLNPRKGDYLLNRTHSTGGIASRLSLELKKRYLLGGSALGGSVIKSGSTSNVDTKLRNFTDAISQHQKLLNPAPEPSPTMQAFLQGTSKLRINNAPLSPLSPTILFSRQLSSDHCRNSSNNIAKPTTLIETSKTQQLPDLVKESSILKSKTAPNICGESSMKDRELINEQVFLQQTNNLTKNAVEDIKSSQNVEKIPSNNMEESNGFRPRSPLHETSIVVPQVDWSKKNEDKDASSGDSEIDSDSLSSSNSNEAIENEQLVAINLSPPRLQIHSTDGDLLLDEGVDRYKHYNLDDGQTFEPDSIEVSFLQDRRLHDSINNTHTIEMVNNNMEQLDLRDDSKRSNCSSSTSEASAISNKQDDSEENDITTAAFTETEFSEWARDGEALVSEDLRDVELDIDPDFITVRRNNTKLSSTLAKIVKEEDTELDYSKIDRVVDQREYPNNSTSKLLVNGEDINYMDTDNESLLDDSLQDASNVAMLKNRGYIEFVNVKTTLSNIPVLPNMRNLSVADAPIARLDLENDSYDEDEEEGFKDANVIEIDPITMEDVMGKLNEPIMSKSSMKPEIRTEEQGEDEFKENVKREQLAEAFNKELLQSMEEDSLLLVEPAEDTTTSEVVTVLASPINPQVSIVPVEMTEKHEESAKADSNNPDYLEYVKRLQSRIAEFSNAKDSIDVRKSRRKNSKSLVAQTRTTEMITEEIKCQETMSVNGNSNGINSPATSRKLEEITRERSKQKDLIQDLLMDKLEAHKQKSAEKKARRAARASSFTTGLSPIKPSLSNISSVSNKFVPTSIMSPINSPTHTIFGEASKSSNLSMSLYSYEQTDQEETKEKIPKKADEKSITTSLEDAFKTPLAPPRLKNEEARRTAEKARQDARERARMKSDEDLGLSPEDRIKELRMKVTRRQLSMDDTKKDDTPKTERIKSYNFSAIHNSELKLQISKSTDNMKNIAKKINFQKLPATSAKSMDEMLNTAGLSLSDNNSMVIKRDKKPKDSERRKSIIQAVSDFFFKKETNSSPNQKDKLSVFRLTSRGSKGKIDKTIPSKCDMRPKSVCEDMLVGNFFTEKPPPVPPPPLNYSTYTTQVSADDDTKTTALSVSCMQKVTATEESCNSVSRKLKTAKKITRQAQLKRLRMAQEIQRKLEETEVKQKELESRGVSVEKALRGEGDSSNREEADLLREWFDLMKERTELRRYEKELLVRAQEVQLEDRHERLQQELRERLADDDDKKTSDDVKKEGEILTEMLEIVAKRDSLIALLEEERQRYQNEDRDLEAQMLAKGLRLTPIKKCGPKYSV
ncbi:MICAL monooxygenase, partial [Acromyrmex heyeri]